MAWASLEALKITKPMVGYEDQISGDERMSTVTMCRVVNAIRVETVQERKQTPPLSEDSTKDGTGSQSAKAGQALLTLCAGKWNQQQTGNHRAPQARAEP